MAVIVTEERERAGGDKGIKEKMEEEIGKEEEKKTHYLEGGPSHFYKAVILVVVHFWVFSSDSKDNILNLSQSSSHICMIGKNDYLT